MSPNSVLKYYVNSPLRSSIVRSGENHPLQVLRAITLTHVRRDVNTRKHAFRAADVRRVNGALLSVLIGFVRSKRESISSHTCWRFATLMGSSAVILFIQYNERNDTILSFPFYLMHRAPGEICISEHIERLLRPRISFFTLSITRCIEEIETFGTSTLSTFLSVLQKI